MSLSMFLTLSRPLFSVGLCLGTFLSWCLRSWILPRARGSVEECAFFCERSVGDIIWGKRGSIAGLKIYHCCLFALFRWTIASVPLWPLLVPEVGFGTIANWLFGSLGPVFAFEWLKPWLLPLAYWYGGVSVLVASTSTLVVVLAELIVGSLPTSTVVVVAVLPTAVCGVGALVGCCELPFYQASLLC
ncbi:uncharacterized protein MELLADRAFT_102300 [Melampsora larici-populina 98AG31]|uniref:Uncharacterized protein n=1 Tax=Melampsora larici-populina (strain 98AG31 / pathotype 3-4-7) TaxID=747676 RepID=F4R7U7_MELLP|nr:uncharacterized protein MELLADRAFT_102300 [Melampsora larici-populina 98AG31]EGG11724.1 hypothetical protein MELLADRAFT_102300 [Melampsora larici-populina 98AG31]